MTVTRTDLLDDCLTINKICKGPQDEDSFIVCVHSELDKILILCEKIKIKKSFWVKERVVSFCPFCGFSYQPERLNSEDADNSVCDSLNHDNK